MGVRSLSRSALALLALIVAALLPVACAAEQVEPQEALIFGEFVGRVSNTESLVSVYAPDPGPSAQIEVSIYVSDGANTALWFKGLREGNSFDFPSINEDAEVQADLTQSGATGTVRLPDGEELEFEASPAQDLGGIYIFEVDYDGRVSGRALNGVTGTLLEGNASLGGTVADLNFVLPSGERRLYRGNFPESVQPDNYTAIVESGAGDARGRSGLIRTGEIHENYLEGLTKR